MSQRIVQPELYFGVATPQANPTVEAEFRYLFGGRLLPVTTRLTSRANDAAERLGVYFDQIGPAIESFATLPLDAFGFACIRAELVSTESGELHEQTPGYLTLVGCGRSGLRTV